jgi:hypothetical protein
MDNNLPSSLAQTKLSSQYFKMFECYYDLAVCLKRPPKQFEALKAGLDVKYLIKALNLRNKTELDTLVAQAIIKSIGDNLLEKYKCEGPKNA